MTTVNRNRLTLSLLLLAAIGVTACDGGPTTATTVTRTRLERSLERTFAHRYAALSSVLGHDDVTYASLDAHAVCDKGGPTVADTGPGGDWNCWIAYDDPHVTNPDGSTKVEMNVHSSDCYTGIGSSKLVGPLNIEDTRGRPVVNPAAEFDACFDPSASSRPDGTLLIVNPVNAPGSAQAKPALTLPTGLVAAGPDSTVPLILVCTDASTHCSGTIDVAVQGARNGPVTDDVPAGGTQTIRAKLTREQVRHGGLINLTLRETSPQTAAAA